MNFQLLLSMFTTRSLSRKGEVLTLSDFKCQADPAPAGVTIRRDCLVTHAANGLHDCSGQPIMESYLRRGERYVFGLPQEISVPADQPIDHLDAVLFLPFVNFGHFGHMLTETVGWLSSLLDPAIDLLGMLGPDTLVLLAANSANAIEGLHKLFELPPDRVISTISIPHLASCQQALIPRPSMINQRAVDECHFLAVRRFVDRWYALDSDATRDRLDRLRNFSVGSAAQQKIYLSRSRLPPRLRRIQEEEKLERELDRRGWRVVYPETLSIVEQLEALRFARVIAGSIGSAFHLLMYFGLEVANKPVIGLGMINGNMPSSYVFQFRQQHLDFRYLCCLKPAKSKKKAGLDIRHQDVMLALPPYTIAQQIERLACLIA